jgi:hypothetical protein
VPITAQGRFTDGTTAGSELERSAAFAPWVIVIYFAIQFGIRFFISTNLERDDAEMVGQLGWAWGYARSHPPLFHWWCVFVMTYPDRGS